MAKEMAAARARAAAALRKLSDRDWARAILFGANQRETAYCIHLILAALIFSPFLLFGYVLAANSDLLLENYPMLLLAKHNFLHGSLGLWNPYSFSGVSEAAEANTPMFLPENWLLFLVPTRFLFLTVTFLAFVKVWLLGVASYRLYSAELLNRRWALFASIALQLSGMTIWCYGSYVALSVLLYYVVLLAIIWTSERRSSFANYLLWSFVTIMMLMSGDIAYSAYALLGAGVLTLYRTLSRYRFMPLVQQLSLFTASSATALAVFCVRLFPTLAIINASPVISDCCRPHFTNSSFLIARYFDTEIFGVNFSESMKFFHNISSLFNDFHIHWVAPEFYGVSAALLALWMLGSEKPSKAIFWSLFVIFGLAALTYTQPVDALVMIFLSPVSHVLGLQIIFAIGLPLLAALGGLSMERSIRQHRISRLTIEFMTIAVIVIAMFILMILLRNIAPLSRIGSNSARLIVIGLPLLVAALWVSRRTYPEAAEVAVISFFGIIAACALLVIFLATTSNATFLSHLKNICLQLLLFAAIAIELVPAFQIRILTKIDRWRFYSGSIIVALAAWVLLYPWTEELREPISHGAVVLLAALGALRFGLGVAIFSLTLRGTKTGFLNARGVYIIFLLLLLAEQIPAGKIDSHINANPFYRGTLYPPFTAMVDTDGRAVDLEDYRIGAPNSLLHLSFYNELFGPGEICGSINVGYGVRSLGGYTDVIPSRTMNFADNWLEPGQPPIVFCVYARTNDRLLDLSAVGYRYDSQNATIVRRPHALSRFMLYTGFAVIPDGTAQLQRLKEPTFNPLEDLILDSNPGFDSRSSNIDGQKLAYKDVSSDRAELETTTDSPALLLFDDSFDPGWRATVNNKPVRILHANYNFMAIPLPAGDDHVVFEYKPRAFLIGAICALAGLAILALAFATYLFRRVRTAHAENSPNGF